MGMFFLMAEGFIIILPAFWCSFSLLLVMQYWELSSKTCRHLDPSEQEVYDASTKIMSVKVWTRSRQEAWPLLSYYI